MQQGRVRGRGRRSPIIVWMQEHRVVLEQGFAKNAPDWSSFAAYLGDHGVLDGDGKRPTAEATRQAWYRTKRMAASKTSARSAAPAVPAPSMSQVSEPTETVSPIPHPPTEPPMPDGARPAPHPRFGGPATLRNHTPAAAPAFPPPPMPTVPRQDSKAVIEALLSRGRPTGFRKPDPQDE